ncbi:Uncharacterized protein FKW44_002077, partial [Caligus rogercresseyi]
DIPQEHYGFTQDGAPAHTSYKVQDICKGNMASFLTADFWPFSSRIPTKPHTQCRGPEGHHHQGVQQQSEDFIKTSCASVRPRIETIIKNNGGHIE